MPQFIQKQKNITIPMYFVETLMPQANPTFVKIYLYALMLAANNTAVDNSFIAAQLGILESDVVGAFAYWQSVGALRFDSDCVEFLSAEQGAPSEQNPQTVQNGVQPIRFQPVQMPNIQSAPAQPVQMPNIQSAPAHPQNVQSAPPTVAENKAPSYSSGDVAKAITENSILSEIFVVAQSMLGKPLSTQDTITLYSFYDWLGFQPEIILLLLDHCVSMGKTNMNYIEKVALSWHEQGLFTAEAVTAHLEKVQSQKTFLYAVRKILGILDRNPTATEETYINSWCDKYNMSEEMVALAYDRCILQTQKLSLPYMDKIMQSWHEQGIHTVEAAELDHSAYKGKTAKSTQSADKNNSNIKKMLGIGDRPLTSMETEFINGWYGKYNMTDDMIALAYEFCVMQTQKLSMPYMDKIIQNWYSQGIHTVEAAKSANENFRSRNSRTNDFEVNNPSAYNYDEIERRMWENMKKGN